jgi:hypothetical protein
MYLSFVLVSSASGSVSVSISDADSDSDSVSEVMSDRLDSSSSLRVDLRRGVDGQDRTWNCKLVANGTSLMSVKVSHGRRWIRLYFSSLGMV